MPITKRKTRSCKCGHLPEVHSKIDGRCLGGTEAGPMSCDCEEAIKVPVWEISEARAE
jgi:hypothetical protein